MAGKSDAFSNDLLKLIFQGVAITGLADNAASAPLTQYYLSLHTADPTDTPASGQATNEVTYTGYTRVPLNRNSGAWSVSGKVVSPVANIDFGECTAGVQTATHWAVGTSDTGAGKMLYSGTLTPTILIQAGVIPRIKSTSTITED